MKDISTKGGREVVADRGVVTNARPHPAMVFKVAPLLGRLNSLPLGFVVLFDVYLQGHVIGKNLSTARTGRNFGVLGRKDREHCADIIHLTY